MDTDKPATLYCLSGGIFPNASILQIISSMNKHLLSVPFTENQGHKEETSLLLKPTVMCHSALWMTHAVPLNTPRT